MQCLQDYIGVRWCKAEDPESNLWINDLPGISMKGLDKIANEEQITFLEAWNTIQRRSIKRFSSAIINELSKRYKLNRTLESISLPKITDSVNEQTSASAQYRGFVIELGWYANMLQAIHIQELSLYLKTAPATGQENVTIKFFSIVETGAEELDSITFKSVQGWNRIAVNKDYLECQKLFIGYDATLIDSVKLQLNDYYTVADGLCGCLEFGICNAIIRGAFSDNPYDNFDTANNTFGLSGILSIKCTFEQLICNNKSLFATSLWYLLGAEAMAERIYTDRLNRYTTVDLPKAKDLRQEFEFQFRQELESVISGIDLNAQDCCLECNGLSHSIEMHP